MDHTQAQRLLQSMNPALWLLTTGDGTAPEQGGRRAGLLAGSVQSASLVPDLPRVVVALGKQHHTTETVLETNQFLLQLLREQDQDLAWRFGLESGHSTDKWGETVVAKSKLGNPRIAAIDNWLDCRMELKVDLGDRWMLIGDVVDASAPDAIAPLTVQAFIAGGDPDQHARLMEQMQRDTATDRDAILTWRRDHASSADASQ